MTDVWYPGRPPLKSPEIIQGLTHYIDALQRGQIEQANRICDDLMDVLEEESDDCLASDTNINALISTLPNTFKAATLCVQHGHWDALEDLIASIDVVRWALINRLDAATGENDGRRTTSTPTNISE
jgi:hypothetical protein